MLVKSLIGALLLSCSLFVSADPVILPQELVGTPAANAALASQCVPACVILSPSDWKEMNEAIKEYVKQAIKEGIKKGI